MPFDKKTVYHSALVHEGPIEVTITSDLLKSKFKKDGNDQYYVCFKDGSSEHQYTCENDDCMDALDGKNGKRVRLEATGSRHEARLSVTVLGSGGGGQSQAAAPRSSGNRSTAPAATGSASNGKQPVHGQTVGMAINQACAMIRATFEGDEPMSQEYLFSSQFSKELHEVASDIIRVSSLLEKGNLAKPVKDRTQHDQQPPQQPAQPATPAPKQSTPPPDDFEEESDIPF